MNIQLDILQTAGLASFLYFLGSKIKSHVNILKKYFIPAPVIGGLLFSLLIFIGEKTGLYYFEMNAVLQDFFMNLFFTAVGFECSIAIVKKSGILGLKLAVIAIFLLVLQNLVGVSLTNLFGLNPLLGVAMGSTAMSGGVGSAVAFGPDFEALGASGGTTIGTAAATFGLLVGSMIGGPVAKRLIDKKKLKTNNLGIEIEKNEDVEKNVLNKSSFLNSFLLVVFAGALGSIISVLLNSTGLKFPYYVGCLFA
ncbi:MAG: sodium/glutamate symporter, partial [Anaerococcus sp.]|nr:sodium/glutamate symporter [Anaerococcus sp.]